MTEKIGLAHFIAELRSELKVAISARDQDLELALGPIDLEVTVSAQREAGPEAKIRFWVVDAGVAGKASTENVQKIRMTLEPRGPSGGAVSVGDYLPIRPQ